eukprot:scaffold113637_cov26-Prasinocladus_malaysianus.AAC.1
MVYGGLAAMAFAAFLNLVILASTKDVVFAAVNVWTFIAIANQTGVSPMVWGAAVALASVVGACAAVTWGLNVIELVKGKGSARAEKQPSDTQHANQFAV